MARLGSQEPTWKHVGSYATSAGDAACRYFAKHGARFYDSQKLEFELMLARDADGGFAAKSLCITKPRQNGKSYAARWYVLWMAMVCHKRCLFSAHHSRTSRDMFKQIVDMLEADEKFMGEVDYIYRAGGYEGIYFDKGGCIEFQTRTNSGGRGGTYSVLVLDEAQELTPAQQDALLPTVSAAGEIDEGESEPQKIYIGTVPGPECQGTVFREMHDRVHAGESDVWWLEWGAQGEKLEDVDVDNVDLWYACNPAMGRRMRESTVQDEHDTMTRDGFARERLGWWSPTAGKAQYMVTRERWDDLEVDSAPDEWDKQAYGVRFTADGKFVALSVCVTSGDTAHVEFIREAMTYDGTAWLVDWLAERRSRFAAVAIDGKADVEDLFQRLVSAGVPRRAVMVARTSDAISASGMIMNAINDGTLTHVADEALEESVTGAMRRKIGNAGGFGFEGEFAERFDACALALWAARTTKRDPNRKGRAGC